MTPRNETTETQPPRQVIKIRRNYKRWVADETLEDYALRYAARRFRRWSVFRVVNTAFGSVSFLAIEATGAAISLNYGFINAAWAAMAAAMIVFLTGLPIAWYAAKYNLDMDLLTRGAGFGYLGSTITSLIYASFTFLLFAIEAAIMAQAINLYLQIPLTFAYLISAFVVIPMVGYGITFLNRLQLWTQPIWLILLVLPYVFVFSKEPGILNKLTELGAHAGQFNLLAFGAATSVALAFIVQIGEQVDFLRFMPERKHSMSKRWVAGVLIAGPGWIVLGTFKLLGGALLAYLALRAGFSVAQASQPAVMYEVGFSYGVDSPVLVATLVVLFVVISQLKINVTNAYAGSLAWSNFFARVTHTHAGRIVWLVFNVLIAFMLMEMGIFEALRHVLGLYSNIAISWVGALVADLVINKPLGLSSRGIQFMRGHLYDINPVGTGALLLASVLSIAAFTGVFGPVAEAFSAFIALGTALITAPLIAWFTRGRFYLAREPAHPPGRTARCAICEKEYETDDMTHCPAYRDNICSLCCTLDARCHDMCRPGANLIDQYLLLMRRLLPSGWSNRINTRLGYYVLLMGGAATFLGGLFLLFFYQQTYSGLDRQALDGIATALIELYIGLMLLFSLGAWWLVLTIESRYIAQEESNRQTYLLMNEISAHQKTEAQLQDSLQALERANQAKTRYLTGISHELRAPLNSILGFAQVIENSSLSPAEVLNFIKIIRRSGEHMTSLLDGLLDISRIEAGKISLSPETIDLHEYLDQLVDMFSLQCKNKKIEFVFKVHGNLPAYVKVDKKRLGQILINMLGNAVKFTEKGRVIFRVIWRSDITKFEVEDTGVGFSEADRQRIFLPFERGSNAGRHADVSAGLGLSIASMLATLMGGELSAHHRDQGQGSLFRLRLYLPEASIPSSLQKISTSNINSYANSRWRLLLVDDQEIDRMLLRSVLTPLGFQLEEACTGIDALRKASEFRPDLILIDINMPGLNGWETSHLLRANHISTAPILVISADLNDRSKPNDAGIGIDDFIAKPIDVGILLKRIASKLQLDSIEYIPHTNNGLPISKQAGKIENFVILPSPDQLDYLYHLAVVGDIDAILHALEEMAQKNPLSASFITQLRNSAENFQLDEFMRILRHHGATHDLEN